MLAFYDHVFKIFSIDMVYYNIIFRLPAEEDTVG